mmetsp:Transcript_7142/g.12520  ORF Transcript_7142/g.12520 Transcript_7142/m.12520 type:complete len:168 (-) Transcript_7142:203-706(-)
MVQADPDQALELPEGWEAVESSTNPGNTYFFNEYSRAARWEKPPSDLRLPSSVKASHILLKHKGSRNPVSRRTSTAITRTAEEAVQQLQEFQDQISRAGKTGEVAKFHEIAKEVSDCSSFKRGGDLGRFGRKKMQPEFENASFHLAINEMSGIIETDSGFHIILRTA